MMEAADPLLLLVSLPLVPVGLVLGKMIKWQDPILKVSVDNLQCLVRNNFGSKVEYRVCILNFLKSTPFRDKCFQFFPHPFWGGDIWKYKLLLSKLGKKSKGRGDITSRVDMYP